ncbi:contactin [Elysia marginata]|uniref:Contactin n=1 Tax=Elysia marginata TaxID=1093978 RepID=A0AAV4FKW8_9GAST|nr:contactin [Elysia marginata]
MNEDFYINVQVFTNAGMGPMSEEGDGGTYIYPPLSYPEFVQVTSFPGNSVFVFWRSVTTGLLEEPIAGYKLRWWPASDNIITANDTVVEGGATHGVIRGLQRGVVYSLRVLGYSAAGDGKKSPTVFFTLVIAELTVGGFRRAQIQEVADDRCGLVDDLDTD